MAEPVTIYTIGYQGRSLEDFAAVLAAAKIDVVVDIRSRPISRRHEFSKNRLAAHLNRLGVAYWHLPEWECHRNRAIRGAVDALEWVGGHISHLGLIGG